MSPKILWIWVVLKLALASKNQDYLPSDHQCWGYEEDCELENSYSSRIQCSSPEDVETFYQEADFGYVRKRLDTMQTFWRFSERNNRGVAYRSDEFRTAIETAVDVAIVDRTGTGTPRSAIWPVSCRSMCAQRLPSYLRSIRSRWHLCSSVLGRATATRSCWGRSHARVLYTRRARRLTVAMDATKALLG